MNVLLTVFCYKSAMKWITLLCLGCLVSCAPKVGYEFGTAPAQRVTIEGSVFDIRLAGRKAQAVRVNAQYAPRLGPLAARAAFAMEQVSGCAVRNLTGDASLLVGALKCAGDEAEERAAHRRGGALDCYGTDSYISAATDEAVLTFDCDWRPN